MKHTRIRANHDLLSMLNLLQEDCLRYSVTNLNMWFGEWNMSHQYGQILRELNIVQKVDGEYVWTAEDPNQEMADLIQETNRQLCIC